MWDQQLKQKRRFELRLPVAFSWRSQLGQGTGAGATLEIASDALLFASPDNPPAMASVIASVDWPVRLEDGCRLRLLLYGALVPAGDSLLEMNIDRYEFRTAPRNGPFIPPTLPHYVSADPV